MGKTTKQRQRRIPVAVELANGQQLSPDQWDERLERKSEERRGVLQTVAGVCLLWGIVGLVVWAASGVGWPSEPVSSGTLGVVCIGAVFFGLGLLLGLHTPDDEHPAKLHWDWADD